MQSSQASNVVADQTRFTMKHLAAYLLLQQGGNASPSASDIKEVLGAVGIEGDDERIEKLLGELKDKDISEVRSHSTRNLDVG